MRANPEKYLVLVLGNTNHRVTIQCADKLIPISKDITTNRLNFEQYLVKLREQFIAPLFYLPLFIATKSGTIVGIETLASNRK